MGNKIVVIDDDPRFRNLLKALLESAGYDVLEARSGADAMKLLSWKAADLAIVDYRLPDINGMKLISDLRERGNEIVTVFLSGIRPDAKTLRLLYDILHVSAVVEKPIEPVSFLRLIKSVLGQEMIYQQRGHTTRKQSTLRGKTIIERELEELLKLDAAQPRESTSAESFETDSAFQADTCETMQSCRRATVECDEMADAPYHDLAGTDLRDYPHVSAAHRDAPAGGWQAAPVAPQTGPGEIDRMSAVARQTAVIEAEGDGKKNGNGDRCSISEQDMLKDKIRMADLCKEYERTLPAQIQEFVNLIHQARSCPDDRDLLKTAVYQAHTLAGTTGSYGFSALSSSVRRVYDLLEPALNGGGAPSAADFVKVQEAVADAELFAGPRKVWSKLPQDFLVYRVLVLDSDALFSEKLLRIAAHYGLELIPVHDAGQARMAASTNAFDAALISFHYGHGVKAAELAKTVRNAAANVEMPVAFMSERAQAADLVTVCHTRRSMFLDRARSPEAILAGVRKLIVASAAEIPRVVVLDSDDEAAGNLASVLAGASMSVRTLARAALLPEMLERFSPHLVILDVSLPDMSGLDACRLIKGAERWQDVSVMFLTAKSAQSTRLSAFSAGADEYVVKPFNQKELLARASLCARRAARAIRRGNIDCLTDLLLRAPFMEQAAALLQEAQEDCEPFGMCCLDLDCFKEFNQVYGHQAGDDALGLFAALLVSHLGNQGIAGRLGGEEFVLAFKGQPESSITEGLQRLEADCRNVAFSGPAAAHVSLSFSAGVARYPGDGLTLDELMKEALRLQAENSVEKKRERID